MFYAVYINAINISPPFSYHTAVTFRHSMSSPLTLRLFYTPVLLCTLSGKPIYSTVQSVLFLTLLNGAFKFTHNQPDGRSNRTLAVECTCLAPDKEPRYCGLESSRWPCISCGCHGLRAGGAAYLKGDGPPESVQSHKRRHFLW